jgi:ATP-dependent exoDNAse (exonuclease V) beta subunit
MRSFEDRFITLGLPYRVIGGPRFYERQEIRDALAYFKVTVAPDNDLAFERIINVPKRGIGEASVQKMHELARRESWPLTRAAQALAETDELPAKARRSLGELMAAFARWRTLVAGLPHTELAEIILDESGYTDMWEAARTPDAESRLENLKELVRSMSDYDTMTGFLEHVALVMDTDTSESDDKVSIMTLHGAKGLEFDTVFLPGWEEGLFPHQRALDENGQAGLEEERRLAYVGLTRARRGAVVSFAQNRRVHNRWQSAVPSRFIDELPEAHVTVDASQSYGGYGVGYGASRFDEAFAASSYQTPGWQRAQAALRSSATVALARAPSRAACSPRMPRFRRSSPASGCSTRNSATARSPASTATSSRSRSSTAAKNASSTPSSSAISLLPGGPLGRGRRSRPRHRRQAGHGSAPTRAQQPDGDEGHREVGRLEPDIAAHAARPRAPGRQT